MPMTVFKIIVIYYNFGVPVLAGELDFPLELFS